MNIATNTCSSPNSWTPLMSGMDAQMNGPTLSSLNNDVFRMFKACVQVMTWESLSWMSGRGKNFIHMSRYPLILRTCLEEIRSRRMPLHALINVVTAEGEHSAYDLNWHNDLMKRDIGWWGGHSVNRMPRNSLKTGRDRGLNVPVTDSRNRRFQGHPTDSSAASESAAGQEQEEEPLLEV